MKSIFFFIFFHSFVCIKEKFSFWLGIHRWILQEVMVPTWISAELHTKNYSYFHINKNSFSSFLFSISICGKKRRSEKEERYQNELQKKVAINNVNMLLHNNKYKNVQENSKKLSAIPEEEETYNNNKQKSSFIH